ncbi:hypothetical protein CRV08_06425 [Halarcobacter ebronensis]|uniref:DUF2860 domain-containing protein n=1 Tax=Halarcobacter ebronensis TaxID=1462615 RepID=A0A4Q0YE96_9BACT|nr:DUF2860 family protein [Halarcobacter ebronensis]RXJ68463.1 hypothetical protein CRV08_06425 [Halarcobacter ebronensis]
MKKILLLSFSACILLASEQNFVEFGATTKSSKDNFSTIGENSINSQKAKSESDTSPYLNFFYGYNLSDSTNIYASYNNELRVGSKMNTSFGNFNFGIKYSAYDAWEDPFLLGTNRVETDVRELGAYLEYGLSFSNIHQGKIKYEFSSADYDKENIVKELEREGYRHIIGFDNMWKLKFFERDINYMANVSYEMYDADGKASAYDRYDLILGFSTPVSENLTLSSFIDIGKKNYDKSNPIFNKKIDSTITGINANLRWDNILNYKSVYMNFKAGYLEEDANTDFYDKETTYGIISLGYKF